MQVHWLEQTDEDLPKSDTWLSPREVSLLSSLRFAKRRADWQLGRWTAKHAVASYWNLDDSASVLSNIEVRPAPSGAPELFCENGLAPLTISLSHRNNRAICFITRPAVDLGCDLELVEPHSDTFVSDYFATDEQALVQQQSLADRPLVLAVLWSAKESALKALHVGLRLDTRRVTVEPVALSVTPNRWNPLLVRYNDSQIFNGWWQIANDMVRTVVAAPPPEPPIPLETWTHCRGGDCMSPTRDGPTKGTALTTKA